MIERSKLVKLLEKMHLFKIDFDSDYKGNDFDGLTEDLFEATAVGSWLMYDDGSAGKRRHVLALDIDHEAYLVPSTTPEHNHLYINVPGGIDHEVYMDLLDVLARAGVIEEDYARASKSRGYTSLRLPWIKKEKKKISQAVTKDGYR